MEFDDDRIRQLTDMVAYVARVLFFHDMRYPVSYVSI
jgi:hypothetical protein